MIDMSNVYRIDRTFDSALPHTVCSQNFIYREEIVALPQPILLIRSKINDNNVKNIRERQKQTNARAQMQIEGNTETEIDYYVLNPVPTNGWKDAAF